MKKLVLGLALSLLLLFSPAAFAEDVLYLIDWDSTVDVMGPALETLDLNVTQVSSLGDLEIQMGSSDWDLVVISFEISGFFQDTPNFIDYVNTGGKTILANFGISYDTPGDRNYVMTSFFGAVGTDNSNLNTISPTAEGVAAGLEVTSQDLTNPTYRVFSYGLTAITDSLDPETNGTVAATFENGDAAIIISHSGNAILNGFLNGTPMDNSLFTTEIEFLLDLDSGSEDADGDGCNISALPSIGLLLMLPLVFLSRKRK